VLTQTGTQHNTQATRHASH